MTIRPRTAGPFITGFTAEKQVNMRAKLSVRPGKLTASRFGTEAGDVVL